MKQTFDNVSPENLSLVLKEIKIALVLAEAILREQTGGKYDVFFQGTRISDTFRLIDKTRRKGESLLVQPDDEKCLQGFIGWVEEDANGCQDQEQCWTT